LAEQEQAANQPLKALVHYNKTVELNANIATVYYNMGICYQQLDSMSIALEMYDKAIDIARKTNKPDVQTASRNASKNYLKTKGIKAKDAQNWKLAMDFFKKAQQVDDTDADNYLLLALCANKAQLWDETIAATTKGITVEKRSAEKARLQFEEAIAWFNKGDVKKSCSILKLITDPAYKTQAAKQIAANKCDAAN
jgi:tetratricopeptide (TPR) repeat protein